MTIALINLIDLLFQAANLLIIIEVIGSLLIVARVNLPPVVFTILSGVHNLVQPALAPIRRFLPNMGGLDFSPMIALVLLDLLRRVVITALLRL